MDPSPFHARLGRLPRWGLAVALVVGVLAGILIPRIAVEAQATQAQTYTVLAGSDAAGNTALLSFAPNLLQVHRGDTVQWVIMSFHNVHFEQEIAPLVVAPEVDGKPLPQLNPAIAFPTVENGGTYSGGDANSGIPLDPANASATFSLVMDAEPGHYSYFCDIHPGMVGTITIVDNATSIPSPAEVLAAGAGQLLAAGGTAMQAAAQASMQPPTVSDSGALQVKAGLQAGTASVLQFFPSVAVIDAGQSVTWSIDPTNMEPHFVAWPSFQQGTEFDIMPQEGGPPIIALNENSLGTTPDGAQVGAEGTFNSGLRLPGQSFTLTFTEPGVYNYVCPIHAGMQGVVIVQPAS